MHSYDTVPTVEPFTMLELMVTGIADLVLKVSGLADRYELNLGRMTEPAAFAAQQARVRDLRWAAERGRNRLIEISRSS